MSNSETIELACLGRPFQLGMLYDCRRDLLIPGITLWDAEMLQKNINVRPQPNTDFKIIATDSSEDKASALNVSASLEASFLCGLVSVKGSAEYLNNKKSSKHHSRVTLQYYTTSRFEQLTMEHLGAGNLKHCNVFQEGSATHVVTALLYGAQAFFIFDREVSSNESHQKIQGDLQASIKKIPLISVEGQASLKMNEMEQEKIDKFSCTFHGDFALENNPVSYVDAIKVYSELPKMLGEHGENAVPMTVWLYPLKKLDSAAAQLVREISVSLIRRAQRIMNELHNCDIQCKDLMRDNIAIQFPEITAKISNCKDFCSEYKIVFQKHLCRVLPSIMGGGKEGQELAAALNDKESSPSHGALVRETIQAFLDFKEANKGRTNIEFCIASIPDELSTASSIHVYERGRLINQPISLTELPVFPSSCRIGVYLDHRGILSFCVSDTMTLIHRVQTTFTQPLYPGFGVYFGSTLKICHLTI
uniref:Stonustoxin-like helical domain-containing protein n=1 Tax=Cyprinus carpio TaxID=7962 RepID=A0A8C2IPF0_CYPCA